MNGKDTWKAQLSFEFMMYIAVSAIALVVAVPVFMKANSTLSSVSGSAELQNLASAIDARLGYQSSAFDAYLPKALCGASLANGAITYMNSSYPIGAEVSANIPYLCGISGSIQQLQLQQQYNGTYLLT